MPPPIIYLDNNATTPMLPAAAEAVREASLQFFGNPASQHGPGREARRALEDARRRIGRALGAQMEGMEADRVILTSGGTEANNLALTGLLPREGEPARLVISALEHPSIYRTAMHLCGRGVRVEVVNANHDGVVDPEQLKLPAPNLVSVMLASNETGVVQPVAEIASRCRAQGVVVHTDAVQAVGKIPVSFRELGVDALTATAHKFHGPLGVGVLVVRHGVQLMPLMHGGFQQASSRPGTETTALAIGMATALELVSHDAASRPGAVAVLRDRFEQAIVAAVPGAAAMGADVLRLPNTSNIAFRGIDRQAMVMALDVAGVACSTGSACASGSSEPSTTLLSMGVAPELISSSIRFSLSTLTTREEVDEAARRIIKAANQLRRV